TRVALVAFVEWPAGWYWSPSLVSRRIYRNSQPCPAADADIARIKVAAKEWISLLPELSSSSQVVVVVQPEASTQGGKIKVDWRKSFSGVALTTPGEFADLVGPFLAEEPYLLDPRILELLHSRLMDTGREDATIPAPVPDAHPPVSGASEQQDVSPD